MGKAKRKTDGNAQNEFPVDLKAALAVKPESRAKWIIKACKHASNGAVDVKHLYDTLANKRMTQDVTEKKVGQRMFKALQDNVWVFSDKQQRYLLEDSTLATQFSAEDGAGSEPKEEPPRRTVAGEDAAARMEEMMARCRDFVREKADSFEDRQKEAKLAEQRALEARQREERERRRREWEKIAAWHQPLEEQELTWMASHDDREGGRVLDQHNSKKRGREESGARNGREREASMEKSRKRDKDRDRDRDRDRERRRRRRSSSS